MTSSFEKKPLSVFKFEKIFDDERLARASSDKAGLAEFPDQRLEKVIVPNFDVGRGDGRGSAAKKDVFARGFEKIVGDLVRAPGEVSAAAADRLRVGAGARDRNAVKIGEERVDDRDAGGACQEQAACSFVLRSAVHPDAVENDVVCGRANFGSDQRGDARFACGACDFQTDQSIVVCS